MEGGTEIPEPKRKLGCGTWVLIVLCLALVTYIAYRLTLRARVSAELDRVREAGYPVTLEELAAWYETPPVGQNAADVYLSAFVQYVAADAQADVVLPLVGAGELPPVGVPLSAEMQAAIAKYLADNEQALKLLHQGAGLRDCRWPVDLTQGFNALLPYLSQVRYGSRMLALDAILNAKVGQPDEAVESVTSGLALARSLSAEPILISQLVRIACQAITLKSGLQRVLSSAELTDDHLSQLNNALEDCSDPAASVRGLAGEQCRVFVGLGESITYETFPAGGPSRAERALCNILYTATGLRDLDRCAWLRFMSQVTDAAQERLPDSPKRIREAQKAVPAHCILTRLLAPANERYVEQDLRATALLSAARVAVATERHRLANGKLADALSDLVPKYLDQVPIDPFDGKPLRYKKLKNGYVVYSVGPDGVDDGGSSEERASEGGFHVEPADVTFSVERAPSGDMKSEGSSE